MEMVGGVRGHWCNYSEIFPGKFSNSLDTIHQHRQFPCVSPSRAHAQTAHQARKKNTIPWHDSAFEEAASLDIWHSIGTESQVYLSTFQLLQLG